MLSGGFIDFNRTSSTEFVTFDSAGLAVLTRQPAHIILAHELIHADRAMRGVTIPLYQGDSISLETARAIFGTRTITHTFQLEEMATIGIGNHHTANCITENMIRSEHGLAPRASHLRTLISDSWLYMR